MKKMTKRLLSVALSLLLALSTVPVTFAQESSNANLLEGKDYTLDGVVEWYRGEEDEGYLTDGIIKGNDFYEPGFVGTQGKSDVEVTFDLADAPITFKELHMHTMVSIGSGVNAPHTILVEYKADAASDWEVIYKAIMPTDYKNTAIAVSDEAITAAGLRFTFYSDKGQGYNFIDEIEAFAEPTGEAYDGKMEVGYTNENVLAGKGYTSVVAGWYNVNVTDEGPDYYLTDGNTYIGSGYGSGHFGATGGDAVVTFDFGADPVTFQEIILTVIAGRDGIASAKYIEIEYKEPGSDEWVKIVDRPNGETNKLTFVFTAEEEFTASALKLHVVGLSGFVFLKELEAYAKPTGAAMDAPMEDYVPNTNILAGLTYTHNGSSWYKDGANDSASTFLTDGTVVESFYSSNYYGVTGEDATINFDLGEDKEISEIVFDTMGGGVSGVYYPAKVTVYAKSSTDEDWTPYFGKALTSGHYTLGTDTPIVAKELRFEFKREASYLFISEISAYSRKTYSNIDAPLKEADVNLLTGLTPAEGSTLYETLSKPWDGCKDYASLTDGIMPTDDKGYKAFVTFSNTTPVVFVYDTEGMSINEVSLALGLPDISDLEVVPKSIIVEGFIDGEWKLIGEKNSFADVTAGKVVAFASNNAIEADQIRITIMNNSGFMCISEIQVFDKVVTSGAGKLEVMPYNDNLFAGLSYTNNVENWYNGASRDDGTALTDGEISGDFYGEDYFNAQQKGAEVEFSFDAPMDISEFMIKYYVDANAGITVPKTTIYFKSGSEWTAMYSNVPASGTAVLSTDTPITADGVKFVFDGAPYAFVKEIEAYTRPTGATVTDTLKEVEFSLIGGLVAESNVATFAYMGTTDMAVLTDGMISTDAVDHKKNITFSDTPAYFTYEKAGMAFKEVNVSWNNPSSLAVASPAGIIIEVLIDGEWIEVTNCQDIPAATVGTTYAFVSENTIVADGVKVTVIKPEVAPEGAWGGMSLSEIAVFKNVQTAEPIGTMVCDVVVTPPEEPEEAAVPTITTDLATTAALTEGDALTLSVVAETSDEGTLSYQWYKGDDAIAGATNATYTIAAVAVADAGSYKVVVTNTLGEDAKTATSAVCVVTVEEAVTIMYGDVTGDGKVNRSDLLRLAKYFGGATVEINEANSDVTGDGRVNRSDLLRLAKYFGGASVTLGPAN